MKIRQLRLITKMGNKQEKINKEQDVAKAKIVGKAIGEKIEKAFADEFDELNKNGTSFALEIEEIKRRVPEYSSGNGHSALRNQERGGKSIGYLCDKYRVKKQRKNDTNLNSRVKKVILSKK
ncbi:heme ABC transporter substrate-binding protein [Campylobacter upsaliensis]|nr:heme ABC transporter substrate-binding protein [Campylobacter upsaliensis]